MLLKRMLCLMMAILLIGLSAFALGEEAPRFSMAGFDGDESPHLWSTNQFFDRMEARTGISFSFDEHTDFAKWQAAKAAMFETGELPDVLFKAELTEDELERYTESGQLIDLAPLLPEHAPNVWALLEQNPAYREAITLQTGKIGALPGILTLTPQNAMWINHEWLGKVSMDMPTDTDSLREVLKAFQSMDPNQNGKRDEIPLAFFGVWDLKFLSHAFGVAMNDYNLYMDDAGQVRYFPLEEGFKAFVTLLRDLYAEKLLDQNGFYIADTLRVNRDEKQDVLHGVFFGPNPMALYPHEKAKQYTLLPPLVSGGKQVYRGLVSPVTTGAFALTSACPDPAAMLRWVDILYTEAGAIEALAGIEELDYAFDGEGRWQWLADSSQMNDLSLYETGNMPWLFPLEFYNRYTELEVERINGELEALQALTVNPFANCRPTAAQREELLALQSELGKYVDEGLARFVLGQQDITQENMEVFREGLKERGADALTAIWQSLANEK